nr:MAG TPA: hypothetical protein [Caudoviricetes sp.]
MVLLSSANKTFFKSLVVFFHYKPPKFSIFP